MKSLFAVLLISAFFIACKKDGDHPPSKNEPTRDSLLVSNVWQIQKIHVLQNNVVLFYERGGQNNDYNYDNDYLKFEKDGTGTYTAGGNVYNITWQFDNVSRTELTYLLHDYANGQPWPGVDLEIKLENIFLSESSFRYAELYTNENGTETICSVYREKKN